MNLWQDYKRPTSVAEAIRDLTTASESVMPLAGGTDLLLDLKQGRIAPVHTLIDLTFVPEMTVLELRGEELYIGAAVPVSRVALHPLVAAHAQALGEACNLIAGPQVRNAATLGGNVAHALPAADGTIALAALDAQAEIAGVSGTRRMPFTSLFLGPGKTALDRSSELIVGFYIPAPKTKHDAGTPRASSCFKRIMRPQGVALPILNCAIWLARQEGLLRDLHIAVGPGGPTPFRATAAENVLRAQPLNEETIERALEAVLIQVQFRTSPRRASADYRKHIIAALFKEVMDTAWQRAARN